MNTNQIRDVIDIAYKEYSMIQNPIEIQKFSEFFVSLNCKNVLEIGTFLGGTFYTMCKLSNTDGKKISIDCPDVIAPGSEVVKQKHNQIDEYLVKFAKNVVIIRDNSKSEECFQKLEKELQGESLDFIFIDGDHTYEGVKSDFTNYKKYLKDGGYIAFHHIDYLSSTISIGCEVYKFWNELKDEYDFIEFKQGSFGGIGLVQVFKHKKDLDLSVSFESPNKISISTNSHLDFNGYISIRDKHTKIPIYHFPLSFTGDNQTCWFVPLINYNFTDDPYIGSFELEFYDINKHLVDSKELKIKDVYNKIENVGTRIYDGFDSLWINYKQIFLDKIYDIFIDDNIETVIDVGANVGIFSNYISWKKNIKLIHAIEPVLKPFVELKKQFYYYNNIKCHKLGIHYKNGKDFMNVPSHTTSVEEVNVCTLPEFMDNCALNIVDLIKLDVGGLEYEILNSMNDKQILRSKNWLIQYHINVDGKAEILQNRFSRLGYLVTNVPDQNPNNIVLQGFFFAKKI